MDPQQELFTALRQALVARYGEDMVFDGFMPPEDTPYPFVYVADSTSIDIPNKTAVWGRVTQTVHVWHNDPHERGTLSQMMLDIKGIARTLNRTKNFFWFVEDVTQRILPDNTTKTPLLHGVLELQFHFS